METLRYYFNASSRKTKIKFISNLAMWWNQLWILSWSDVLKAAAVPAELSVAIVLNQNNGGQLLEFEGQPIETRLWIVSIET